MMTAWRGQARRWLRWLSWPLLATLSVAIFTTGFYLTTVRPAQYELNALQRNLTELRAQRRLIAEKSARQSPRLQLVGFYQTFPAAASAPDLLERIYAAALANHLELSKGDYRITRNGQAQLDQYQLTLPLNGRYPDIRGFLDEVLSTLPTASLDHVAFERQKIGETAVQVTVRLTLYLRGTP